MNLIKPHYKLIEYNSLGQNDTFAVGIFIISHQPLFVNKKLRPNADSEESALGAKKNQIINY